MRLGIGNRSIILLGMSMVGASQAVPCGGEPGGGGGGHGGQEAAGRGRLPDQAEQQPGARLVLGGAGGFDKIFQTHQIKKK